MINKCKFGKLRTGRISLLFQNVYNLGQRAEDDDPPCAAYTIS